MTDNKNLIDDFGQKIGGAKKDWYREPLNLVNLEELNHSEKLVYVKRDNIWKKPDFEKLYEDGVDPSVIWFINKVRVGCKPKPDFIASYSVDDMSKRYIEVISEIRDKAMSLRTEDDITGFKNWFINKYFDGKGHFVTHKNELDIWIIENKTLKAAQTSVKLCREGEVKDLLGIPHDKVGAYLAKDAFVMLPYNERNMTQSTEHSMNQNAGSSETRYCLAVSSYCGTSYYYSEQDPSTIVDEAKEQGWVILNNHTHRIIASGIPEESLEKIWDAVEALCQKEYDLDCEKKQKIKDARKKTGKKAYELPHLEQIVRYGKDYAGMLHREAEPAITEGKAGQMTMCFDEVPSTTLGHAQGQDYLDTFGFKGGEFGNWINQKERQQCLDYGYNALKDLANIVGISDKDISLGGNLSIAFGSRGKGSARAHYEPLRQVINLTRMKGAGSLAHEWFHALDHYYNYKDNLDAKDPKLFSSSNINDGSAFNDLIKTLKFKYAEDGTMLKTDFLKGSIELDSQYAAGGHGYFSSDCEMLARAFACYVEDKMRDLDIKSDYLSNHADTYCDAIPKGEERKMINEKFEAFFEELRERGILHKRDEVFEKDTRTEDLHMVSDEIRLSVQQMENAASALEFKKYKEHTKECLNFIQNGLENRRYVPEWIKDNTPVPQRLFSDQEKQLLESKQDSVVDAVSEQLSTVKRKINVASKTKEYQDAHDNNRNDALDSLSKIRDTVKAMKYQEKTKSLKGVKQMVAEKRLETPGKDTEKTKTNRRL